MRIPQAVKQVLAVHTRGGVGDVLLSTPVLEAVKKGWPDSRLTMMVRRAAAGIVEANPFVDDLMVVDEGIWDRGAAFRRQVAEVKRRGFDVGIVLWSKAPEARLLYQAGIPVRVGQAARLLYSFLYTHPVRIRSELGDTTSHWVDIQLDYARALNLPTDGLRPLLVVGDRERQEAARLLEGTAPRRIGFSIGKGMDLTPQRWPVEAFARMADAAGEAADATVVLTGSLQEKPVVDAVQQQMTRGCLNLAGATSLMLLAGVMSHCLAFVCPDSGPMHMASAIGVPTVGIFAMRCEFPDRWRPSGTGDVLVRPEPIVCPPGCQKETCQTFTCYRQLSPESVAEAVRQVLTRREGIVS